MNDKSNELKRLLEKKQWTAEEMQWLLNYLEDSEATELKQIMQRSFSENVESTKGIDHEISGKLLKNIHQKIGLEIEPKKSQVVSLWAIRMAVAASVISLLILGANLWFNGSTKEEITGIEAKKKADKDDIAPGGNKAVLTLANGSTIVLDDAQNGTLAQQGSTKVIKLNGKLDYNASESSANEILYNTLATPRGGQYQIELPDGSQVWLNAASSLRFPTAFVGKERRVEITGEAYFEVAKNKAMPFIVKVNNSEVQVLGTHFNIMAYNDEGVLRTTLLEGSVKFSSNSVNTLLSPGQQSNLTSDGSIKVLNNVDVKDVTAWKNGVFNFDGANIESVCRQLARWYNVDIVYSGTIDDLFYAKIPRNTNLSKVLDLLQRTGKVHFGIEGKKLLVKP